MRIVFWLLALVVLFAAPSAAYASVQIDIDLSSQTMTVHSGSGETYVWPISSGRPGYLTPRGVFRPRALYPMAYSPKYGNAPMPHSIVFYRQYAIHGTTERGQSRPARVARLRPAFARATRRRCSPWCSGKARKSASSDLRSATLRAANGAPGPRSLLRRSAIRGRSKNGRAIRWRAERASAPVTSGLTVRHPRRNSRARVSRFPSV